MTTITIERELLVRIEKELFLAVNYGGTLRDEPLLKKVSAVLALASEFDSIIEAIGDDPAPATAPAQPEIVDLLAEMYELILANKVVLAEKSGGVWTWPDRAIEAVRKHRSGPAQPERKPKPFIGTRSAIYKCTDCGHEQSVQEIHTEYGVYVGSGANWCDKCGDGKPERKETP